MTVCRPEDVLFDEWNSDCPQLGVTCLSERSTIIDTDLDAAQCVINVDGAAKVAV